MQGRAKCTRRGAGRSSSRCWLEFSESKNLTAEESHEQKNDDPSTISAQEACFNFARMTFISATRPKSEARNRIRILISQNNGFGVLKKNQKYVPPPPYFLGFPDPGRFTADGAYRRGKPARYKHHIPAGYSAAQVKAVRMIRRAGSAAATARQSRLTAVQSTRSGASSSSTSTSQPIVDQLGKAQQNTSK